MFNLLWKSAKASKIYEWTVDEKIVLKVVGLMLNQYPVNVEMTLRI